MSAATQAPQRKANSSSRGGSGSQRSIHRNAATTGPTGSSAHSAPTRTPPTPTLAAHQTEHDQPADAQRDQTRAPGRARRAAAAPGWAMGPRPGRPGSWTAAYGAPVTGARRPFTRSGSAGDSSSGVRQHRSSHSAPADQPERADQPDAAASVSAAAAVTVRAARRHVRQQPGPDPAMTAPASADALRHQHRPRRDQRLHRTRPGAARGCGPAARCRPIASAMPSTPKRGPGRAAGSRAATRSSAGTAGSRAAPPRARPRTDPARGSASDAVLRCPRQARDQRRRGVAIDTGISSRRSRPRPGAGLQREAMITGWVQEVPPPEWSGASRIGFRRCSWDQDQVVAAAHRRLARPGPARRAARPTGPWPGSTASGSTSSHGSSTVARSGVPGCGSSRSGSSLRHAVHAVTTSTSSVRGPQRTLADPPGGVLQRLPAAQPAPRVGVRVVDDEHGVQEVGLVDAAPRRRLVHRRRRDQHVGEPGARRPRRCASRSPRLEPSDRTARVIPGRSGAARPRGCDDRDVGELQRDRGLRLVQRDLDRVHPPVGAARRRRSGRPRSRSGRAAGRPTIAADPLGQLAVVQGVGQVVGRGGRGRSSHTVTSTTKSCPSRRSWSNTPWCPRTRRPRQRRSGRVIGASRAGPGRRRAELPCRGHRDRVQRDSTSCTRTPHAPAVAASALIAAVASSRPSGGRGVPSSSASSSPRNRLRDAPTSTGKPERQQHVQPAQQRPVVRGGLGEAQAGVEHEPRRVAPRPAPRRRPAPPARRAPRRPRRRSAASASIRVAVAAPVHEDPRHAAPPRRPAPSPGRPARRTRR